MTEQTNLEPFEPVFMVRGSDPLAAKVARYYADQLERDGGPADMVKAVRKQADDIANWRKGPNS